MNSEKVITKEEVLTIDHLDEFLSLRVGERISKLQILKIRKVVNSTKQDNLSNVDYKYLIETKDKKILMVNSWVLWKKIADVLKQAGRIDVDLELVHSGVGLYQIRVI